jgi:hypothetical protein
LIHNIPFVVVLTQNAQRLAAQPLGRFRIVIAILTGNLKS